MDFASTSILPSTRTPIRSISRPFLQQVEYIMHPPVDPVDGKIVEIVETVKVGVEIVEKVKGGAIVGRDISKRGEEGEREGGCWT